MRLAIISDIHSNLEALERTFEAIDEVGVDATYCLGDLVGYNADPSACIELVRERCTGVVLGNHDAVVAGGEDMDHLPSDAQAAARHNRSQLSEEQLNYLASLPLILTVENCTFVHATPDAPTSWKRLTTYPDAQTQFDHFDTDVCFVGHTHTPAVISDALGAFKVRRGHRYLINVGSVGQPRDQNPQLSFGLFDTDQFSYHNVRLDYDVERAALKIRESPNLPNRLADRLEEGL